MRLQQKSTCFTDIETDGLLDEMEIFYCGVIKSEEGTIFKFRDVNKYIDALRKYDRCVFHNGINFDHPALEKLSGQDLTWLQPRIVDTLVLSRLLYADIKDVDFAKQRKYGAAYPLPTFMFGRHSLKAWGLRLGCMKGDFDPKDYLNADGKPHTWKTVGFSEDMLSYNVQDCEVTHMVYNLMMRQDLPETAIQIEHDIAWLMSQQERNGFKLDETVANELYIELAAERSILKNKLVSIFGNWYAANGQTNPKKTTCYKELTRGDLTQGAPYTKIKVVEFKPSSRHHIARCFKLKYNWEPSEYTDKGEPKLDEDNLGRLKFPEAPDLSRFFEINKVLGMVGDGKNAWLKLVDDGFIYGSINPNGAGTGRATHSRPNVAQVPKGAEGSIGYRCRQAFTVPTGWLLLGTDAAGLELRCLANRMARWDGGAYAEIVINGDVHWHNTIALGLVPKGTVRDKHNPRHEAARDLSKTWIYAFLYGAGDELLGETVGYTDDERTAWREAEAHLPIIKQLKRRNERATPDRIAHILKGKELRASFIKSLPAIKELQKWCKEQHKVQGGVVGLDGRFIKTRSGHSATNFLLQGDGAVVCKLWGIYLFQKLRDAGHGNGWGHEVALCAWVHDEYQIAIKSKDVGDLVGRCAEEAIREVGETFDFKCRLDADYDIGTRWSETH